ncbi:MAG: GNAT family N-acetyltransferase [Planctomycetes bacterium]|nr:GNAT family N-acetyltransferase [Planctomycetota bacterium]
MAIIDAVAECPVRNSFRVRQVAGLFDVPLGENSVASERFLVEVPDGSEPWQIGAIVGPSGSGKSTVAQKAYGDAVHREQDWPADKAVIDGFGDLPIKTITHVLTAVGFSSPPAWINPYSVLSNGEKFRCNLARVLLSQQELVVFDEFTSVVDRTVAKIGSAAVSKAVRSGRVAKRFVAVSCHYDILEWLEPDWVVDMATCQLARGCLRRPSIDIKIFRCRREAWRLFAKHHYLSGGLHPSVQCYLASLEGKPVCFIAVLHMAGRRNYLRISRVVTLPDYQGIGIASHVLDAVCDLLITQGKRVGITTSHPAMISHLKRSSRWRAIRFCPAGVGRNTNRAYAASESTARAVASFRYVGKGADLVCKQACRL